MWPINVFIFRIIFTLTRMKKIRSLDEPPAQKSSHSVSTPVEISAAQILLTYWDDNTSHTAIYIAVLCIAVCLVNIFGVQ